MPSWQQIGVVLATLVASVGILVTVLIEISSQHHAERAAVVDRMNKEFDTVKISLRMAHKIVLDHTNRLARIEGQLAGGPAATGTHRAAQDEGLNR